MSNPHRQPPHHSMFAPYGFIPFGAVSPMQYIPAQPVFFSPASSVASIPAMFEMPQGDGVFGAPQVMPPRMMMSPPPGSSPPAAIADPRFSQPMMRNSIAVPDGSGYRVIYQPMLVRVGPDGTPWQIVDEGAPPDVVGDYRQEEQNPSDYSGENQPYQFQPDVVQVSTELEPEPTYMNEQQTEQPSYANEPVNEPVTYANESEEPGWSPAPYSPNYTQTLPSPQAFKRSNDRAGSMPPLQMKTDQPPVAPPRSRMGSRRGSMTSLADSILSLDVAGLTDRLKNMAGSILSIKDRHPVHQEKAPPNRPPRRKDRVKRSVLRQPVNLSAIEEDQNRYDVPPKEEPAQVPKPPTPPPEPRVPMPGTSKTTIKRRATSVFENGQKPMVPMPGTISYSKSTSDIIAEGNLHHVAVPMPGSTACLVDEPRPVSAMPRIPMPTGTDAANRFSMVSADTFGTAMSTVSVPPHFPFGFQMDNWNVPTEKSSLAMIGDNPVETVTANIESGHSSNISPTFDLPNNDQQEEKFNSNPSSSPTSNSSQKMALVDTTIKDVYASAVKRRDGSTDLNTDDNEVSPDDDHEKTPEPFQPATIMDFQDEEFERERIDKAFRAAFFGIRESGSFESVASEEEDHIMSEEELHQEERKKSIIKVVKKERKVSDMEDGFQPPPPVPAHGKHELFMIVNQDEVAPLPRKKSEPPIEKKKSEGESTDNKSNGKTKSESPNLRRKTSHGKSESPKLERKSTERASESPYQQRKPSHGKSNSPNQKRKSAHDSPDQKRKSIHGIQGSPNNKRKSMEGVSENDSDTETLDVSLEMEESDATVEHEAPDSDADTVNDFFDHDVGEAKDGDKYNELVYKAVGATWDEVPGVDDGLPPPLILHSQLRSVKLDLLSSIFQNLYPTEEDCILVCQFMSCPASLEEKYTMIRLSDLLKRNKRMGIELEALAEAMSQLAKIGQELMRPEDDRDPMWRTIPVAKEIMIAKGFASRAPWENIEGGREILESLGYTEYTGFALQYPRAMMPEFFADHIGNLTVELVLAAVEISTLLIRVRPNLETLAVLQEAEAFPGNDAEVYYPEVPMLSQVERNPTSQPEENKVSEMSDETSPSDNNQEDKDQHHILGVGRRHIHESEYEEIGPPPLKAASQFNGNGTFHSQNNVNNTNNNVGNRIPCDLCGTSSAMVKCHLCSDQVFCLSCDDMYHRHPKRSTHPRKAITEASQGFRPPLPPKGDSSSLSVPVAPPRRNLRKGSTPDSPFSTRQSSAGPPPIGPKDGLMGLSRSSTLPRKIGSGLSMVGRPLPPPPPVQQNGRDPQPAEPRLMRSHSMAQPSQPPSLPSRGIPPPPSSVSSFSGQDMMSSGRKLSTSSQPPMHLQSSYHGQHQQQAQQGTNRQQPEIPMPGQGTSFSSYPSSNSRMPGGYRQQPQQHFQTQFPNNSQRAPSIASSHHSHMGPRSYQQSYPDVDGSYPNNGIPAEDPWNQNPSHPYHEEIQFPPQPTFQNRGMFMDGPSQGTQTLSRRSAAPSKNRNRFSKLNKSSSLHDIAHGLNGNQNFMNGSDGVTWEDQHWSTQSQIQQPTLTMAEIMQQNGNFKRATSTKSLHQMADPWNGSNVGMWNNDPFAMQATPAQSFTSPVRPQFNPMMNRWMAGHPMFNPLAMTSNGHLHRSMHELNFGSSHHQPNSPGSSQKSSSRCKKSSGRSSGNKTGRRSGGTDSRSQSRNSRRRGQQSRRNETSEEEDLEEEVSSEDEEDEDFFTGESDNDFVSLSSGSNSRRAPRKSWICEHCTYMNNPGVTVCTVCCRTSKMSRGEEELQEKMNNSSEDAKPAKSSSGKSSSTKYRNRKKYNSSDEESEEAPKVNRKKNSGSSSKSGSLKRRGANKGKSPLPKSPENVSDLEQDAINTYYAVRMESKNNEERSIDTDSILSSYYKLLDSKKNNKASGRYESSSEASNANNPIKRPNFEAPVPAKGILKKSNSNPQLTKIEQEAKTELNQLTKKLEKQLIPTGPGKVVDIKKYLAQTQDNPRISAKTGREYGSGDIWKEEQANWMRQSDEVTSWRGKTGGRDEDSPARSTTANAPENDYMSDVASQSSRMYRSISGQSLGDLESHLQDQTRQNQRRTSDVGGKKNFRSKRFSRNLERDAKDPTARRSHSLHMERTRDGDRWVEMHTGIIKKMPQRQAQNSESSSEEAPIHFTATVEGETRGPGGIGSYLARREFGSNEGPPANGAADSGYVSHSSGGHYPRMELPTQAPMESFTMSVDRGFLGRTPGDPHPNMYRSMDDLTVQKATGLELVRLLREAEQAGFTAEDIQVSLNHCGDVNPVSWLKENWDNMMDTVVTLASNVGHEAEENTIGTLSKIEAKDALRKHKGNIWASVTECVEQRQLKYDELCSKGNFSREDIVTVLTAHQGNVEAAFQELNKATLKPFLMRIWGQAETGEVSSASNQPKEKEEVEATILVNENGIAKKLSIDGSTAAAENTYQPGNLLKTIDIPHQQTQPAETPEDVEKFKFDRQVRRLLAEGRITSYEKGELVVRLQEMEFHEDEALVAAEHCEDIYAATKFLRQECELCANVMNVLEIISMPNCEHKCCKECAAKHFTIVIKDRSISEARCPFCHEPAGLSDPDEDDLATEYFAKLDIMLKSLLEQDVHDLFQRKLRDRTLMKDPNFKWCYKCSSGFIADPRNKKLVCPDCRAISCAKCLKPWEAQHEGISCEEFAAWKEANDPDNQAKGLERHMEEHGIECPACKFKYALTKGGCMHFTCSQCKHEFCIGCNKPFKLGVKCGKGPGCAKMGLHSHHPRNCLFYLRDKEPTDLQKLLKNSNIEFMTEAIGDEDDGKCRVQIQREMGDGLMKDDACGGEAPKGFAGFCKTHYVEYLCGLVFRNSVEPVTLLDLGELQQVFTRANHFMPRQRPGEYEYQYKKRLSQVIQNEIPLESA